MSLQTRANVQSLIMVKKQINLTGTVPRERRYFSEAFRKERIKELDEGQTTVSKICHDYGVSSPAVYKWREKYSPFYQKAIVKVVQLESEGAKRRELESQLLVCKTLIADKAVEIEYLRKLIELASEHYQIDFKKNINLNPLNGISSIGQLFKAKG